MYNCFDDLFSRYYVSTTSSNENKYIGKRSLGAVEDQSFGQKITTMPRNILNVFAEKPTNESTNIELATSISARDHTTESRTTEIISNSTSNEMEHQYCQNKECTKATVASFFIGFPVFALAFGFLICCLGFTCGGVAGGSGAASLQSTCYGGATTGCFSIFQSAGAGGCMGLGCIVVVFSIIGSGFATAAWYACLFTCQNLNAN
jgi:hypothetical protein